MPRSSHSHRRPPRLGRSTHSYTTERVGQLRWVGIAVLVLIVIAAAYGLLARGKDLLLTINDIVNPPPKITPLQVASHLHSTSELATAIVEAEAVVGVEQENDPILFIIPNSPTRLIYKAHGEVRAGFDLTQITEKNVEIVGQRVVLNLPPPQILNAGLDSQQSGIYDVDRPWFGELHPDTVNQAQQDAMIQITEQACAEGILDRANQNAEIEFARLLSALEFKEIEILSQSSSSCP